jgi:hypothetical protein
MQTVIRHTFTPEEVAAALIDNIPKSQEIQVRGVDGYVEIDIVVSTEEILAKAEAKVAASETDHAPEPGGDATPKPEPETEKEPPKLGKNAQGVMDLCALGGFQVYLEVDGPEAALAKVLETCCVTGVESFDNNKTALSVAKDLKAEFEAWCNE